MARPPQTYKVVRLYKASPTKKLNIVGSLMVAMKDLTPLALWLYQLFLFAEKDISPSYAFISNLLNCSISYSKTLVEELLVKGYVAIRKVGSETHFIVYYDNLDNIITGQYKKKPSFEKDNYRRKYNRAYKRAVKALETKQKELEMKRNG